MGSLNMSFEEKSIWVSLFIILFVFVAYFSQVFEGLAADNLHKAEVSGMFIAAVVSVIVLEIGLHIAIAIFDVKGADQPTDERDRLFSMKSGNISGLVLGILVLMVSFMSFTHEFSGVWIANILLFAIFISQIVCYALQLFYYRRGY